MTDNSINFGWNFDNTYSKLSSTMFSIYKPTPVPAPEIAIFNGPLAAFLGLDKEKLKGKEGAEVLAGNVLPQGSMPLAQAYAGHQFGHFTILGDGRAVLLGEHITPDGARFDIQLKGSGRTPYSRGGDGRAALGPMLREYIISEAMSGLDIPTTRSLAVIKTGEFVKRESDLTGALLVRVAASHIRVGTFEYMARYGSVEELKELADYTIKRHYSYLEGEANPYLSLLREVCQTQAKLIAKWQLVGFIHGVMNTDNMAISGETIDYGPCAFMDTYNPKTVFSSIDIHGRYAYENQPKIAAWNLARFGEALLPIIDENEEAAIEMAQDIVNAFVPLYETHWLSGMRKKLGLLNEEDGDVQLIQELLKLMEQYEADFTNTFIGLTTDDFNEIPLKDKDKFNNWHSKWMERLNRQRETKEQWKTLMKENNPAVIPRNHRVEEALAAAEKGDYTVMERLLHVLSCPYSYLSEQKEYRRVQQPEKPYKTFCGT